MRSGAGTRGFPLPIFFQNGERDRVRGSYERQSKLAPPHPDPLPVKYGEKEKSQE